MSETPPEPTESPVAEPTASASEQPVEVGPNGYPLNMKPADMSADQRAAYYKHEMRRAQDTNKSNAQRMRELEEKASQWDALDEASKTEQQREVDRLSRELDAAKKAADEQRRAFGAQLVETKLAAAASAKGMTPEALSKLAGDPARFLADGGVDDEALSEFLDALPDAKASPPAPLTPSALGGGTRTASKASGLARGAELYEQMHKKRTSA